MTQPSAQQGFIFDVFDTVSISITGTRSGDTDVFNGVWQLNQISNGRNQFWGACGGGSFRLLSGGAGTQTITLGPGTYSIGSDLQGWAYATASAGMNVQMVVSPIPIPAAAWLFAGALGTLGALRRKAARLC
jgi:hypothetical protein